MYGSVSYVIVRSVQCGIAMVPEIHLAAILIKLAKILLSAAAKLWMFKAALVKQKRYFAIN
jgi:hypothetical protein